jgi:hypothetical protein
MSFPQGFLKERSGRRLSFLAPRSPDEYMTHIPVIYDDECGFPGATFPGSEQENFAWRLHR